jgi:hypothetical protein
MGLRSSSSLKQKLSFPSSKVANDTNPYATILADSIESHFWCTKPFFYDLE